MPSLRCSALALTAHCGGREVYWLAADYYQRAKTAIDNTVASKANTKISQVKKSYPDH